ncbi:MAG: VOC family protein [Anaerolineaceae bacterium]|nr:VOC family protein [Anaerolineaceae bacterium]
MKFAYTIIYVPDVAKAAAFYEQAFGLQQRFVHESGQYAEMETGATTLAFALDELAHSNLPGGFRENDPAQPPAGIEVAFTTADVTAAYQQAVAAGAIGLAEPKTKPWGQVVAYVRDLNGVLVEIGTPM